MTLSEPHAVAAEAGVGGGKHAKPARTLVTRRAAPATDLACPFPSRRGTPARPLAQLGAFERIGIEAQVVTDHLGTGWVVPNDDARGFAEAVVALLRGRCLRHRLGRAGRRTVRGKHAGADLDRRLRGVYETVLAFERRPPEVCLQRPARDATGTIRRAGVVGRG